MKIWILILWIHVGPMSDKDSMAVTSIPQFNSKQQCEQAGNIAKSLSDGTVKQTKFVCVEGINAQN